jgi:calcium channel MID1
MFDGASTDKQLDDSCQVLTDLDFCDSVAYAVPSSPKFKLNDDKLKKLYDDQARKYFQNFENSLDQVACDATSTSKYSLARTCDDCRRDYKNWLCSVLIPRCEDWTAKDLWLQKRNVNAQFADNTTVDMINSTQSERFAFSKSRNPMIDTEIKPGPYKEVLPCVDMCFDIVRSCPASLQFACPNQPARKFSYGERDPEANELRCNFPGAVVKLTVPSAANTVGVSLTSIALGVSLIAVFLSIK